MALEIPDADAAYAVVAGLSTLEQARLLRALLHDMDEDVRDNILDDEGLCDE